MSSLRWEIGVGIMGDEPGGGGGLLVVGIEIFCRDVE